jgi:TonB-linked SusC/RagA family outer membrane protein
MIKSIMLSLLVSLLTIHAIGQKVVTGLVTDENSQPLAGVSVQVKGTGKGTVTGNDGKYSIRADKGQTLVFSFIGNITEERIVSNESVISISLKTSASSLNQVVVVGYGTQKKADLTGAVSIIDVQKTLGSRPITDVARGLQGASPGLTIQTSSGEMGVAPDITLRGVSGSINSKAAPLILLDNVEIPDLLSVNPEDIASISVLKDAASASIYGTKAAWGVILITSKKGSTRKVKLSYDNSFAFSSPQELPTYASDADIIHFGLAYTRRSNPTATFFSSPQSGSFDETGLGKINEWKQQYGGKNIGPEYVKDRDFEIRDNKVFFYRTNDINGMIMSKLSPQQKHNISVSGGNESTTYYASFSALDQKGFVKVTPKPDKFSRYTGNLRIESKISNWLNGRFSMMLSNSSKVYPTAQNFTFLSAPMELGYLMYILPPQTPMGTYNGNDFNNIYNSLLQTNMNVLENLLDRQNVGLTITPLKGLTIDADYTRTSTNVHNNGAYYGIPTINMATDVTLNTILPPSGDLVIASSSWNSWQTGKSFATYNFKLGNHSFKAIAGTEFQYFKSKDQFSKAIGIIDRNVPVINLTTGTQTAMGSARQWATEGFFGRLNYAYLDKYLLELNCRQDGSSQFPPGYRWGTFPSVSAGYVLTNEKFMQRFTNSSILSFLKLRGSWGSIGNNNEALYSYGLGADLNQYIKNVAFQPNYYPYLAQMNIQASGWVIGTQNVNAFTAPSIVSRNLSWERVTTWDFGSNAKFLNNSIGLDFDWFKRITSGLISTGADLPANYGANPPKRNFGELTTAGYELSLTYDKSFKNGLTISLVGNYSDAISKITKFATTYGTITTGVVKQEGIQQIFTRDKLSEISGDTKQTDYLQQMILQGIMVLLYQPGFTVIKLLARISS